MPGDWIKVEKDTPEKAEIGALCSTLGIIPDVAFMKCFKVWRWADSNTVNGHVRSVTLSFLDEVAGLPGFSQALVNIGWLYVRSDSLEFPNFDRHMGQSAKRRAVAANRKRNERSRKASRSCHAGGVTKRRERDKKKTPLNPPFESERFRQAWTDWESHRKQKGTKLTDNTIAQQFKYLASLGESEAIKTLEFSIRQGWTGLWPPKDGSGGRANAPEIDADAEFRRKETIRFRKEQLEREAQIAKERAEANNDPPAF